MMLADAPRYTEPKDEKTEAGKTEQEEAEEILGVYQSKLGS